MCLRWVLSHYNCSDAGYFSVSGAEMTREVKWKEVLLNAKNLCHLFTRFYCCLLCKEGAIKVSCNVLLLLLSHSFSCILASQLCHICNSWEMQFYWQMFWVTIANMNSYQNTHENAWEAEECCMELSLISVCMNRCREKQKQGVKVKLGRIWIECFSFC